MIKFISQLPMPIKLTIGLAAIAMAIAIPPLITINQKQASTPTEESPLSTRMLQYTEIPRQNGMMPNGMMPNMINGMMGNNPFSAGLLGGLFGGSQGILGQSSDSSSDNGTDNSNMKSLVKAFCGMPYMQSVLQGINTQVYQIPQGTEPTAENTASGTPMSMSEMCQQMDNIPAGSDMYAQIFFKM